MKDKIFRILLGNRGKFVSGAKISEKLGVSRTAVWKCIGQLREEGCRIESVSNRGYCLMEVPDRLSGELIRSCLNTNIMGQSMDLHFSIGSTNARARELAQKGAAHGTLVAAEEQVSGRGRLGRSWKAGAFLDIPGRRWHLDVPDPAASFSAAACAPHHRVGRPGSRRCHSKSDRTECRYQMAKRYCPPREESMRDPDGNTGRSGQD